MTHTFRSLFFARVRIAAAVVAAFAFTIALPALAQRPGDRPDLRITKASFNGRDLHVEYTNATGVGYPNIRYEVGFQWYDARGAAVGVRHWLSVPGVERGGVAIFDTKYRTNLTYRGTSGGQYNRTLPEFILQRPNAAEELRVTVDDGDRVFESDESNNIASLRIPLPDLQITGATFRSPNQLEISYRNANPSPIQLPFRIGFTWAAESGTHLTPTRWINVLEPRDGSTTTSVLSRTDASYLTPQGRQTGDRLDWYFERRPGNATRLQVTIDDAGTVREQNEQNNLVSVRPFLPDLVVRDAKIENGRLTFTYGNDGEGYIRDIASRVVFQWTGASGKPIGEPRWRTFVQMDPKQTFTTDAERIDVEYAIAGTNRTTTQRLAAYLVQRPTDAAQLRITIDDEQRITEANEGNNAATVSPPPPPQPDFTITDAVLTADELAFTMRNIGPGATPPGQPTSLWFEWVDATDARVGTLAWVDARSAIAAGQVLRFTGAYSRFTRERAGGGTEFMTLAEFLADIPGNAARLKVSADGPNAIREADETNNIVRLGRPPPSLPDLAMEDATFDANGLTFTVRNGGSSGTARLVSWWVHWADASGTQVGPLYWHDGDAIAAGASHRFTASDTFVQNEADARRLSDILADPPAGATHLNILLDGPNAIRESDEGNNTVLLTAPEPVSVSLTVPSRADGRAEIAIGVATSPVSVLQFDLAFDPTALVLVSQTAGGVTTAWGPGSGKVFTVTTPTSTRVRVVVWSVDGSPLVGTGADSPLITLRFTERDPYAQDTTVSVVNGLAATGRYHPDRPFPPRAAARFPEAVILKRLSPPQPDLVVERITIDADGQPHATIWNRGEGAASSVIVAHEYRDRTGKRLEQGSGSRETAPLGLGPDQKIIAAILGTVPDTAVTVVVTVDPASAIVESDEQNNVKEAQAPMADLVVVEAVPDANGSLALTYRNAGNRRADPLSIWLHFTDAQGAQVGPLYWMDVSPIRAGGTQMLANETVFAMSPAGQIEIRALFEQPPAGATQVKVLLDGPDRIVESNEGNNVALLPIPVVAKPDFTITDPRVDADGKMYFTVRNIGTAGVTSLPVRGQWVQANGESIIGGDRIFSMSAADAGFVSEQVAQSILPDIFPTPDAAAKLRLIADPLARYRETNEENNILEIALPPRMPDLAIADLALTADQATWKLRNIGDPIPPTQALTFVAEFQWLDQAGAPVGSSAGIRSDIYFPTPTYVHNRSTGYSGSASSDYILRRPTGAVALRVTEDSANVIREKDETNNVAEVALPPPPQPDLAFARVTPKWDRRDPKIEYVGTNRGTVDVERIVLGLQWLDASGRASGPAYAPFEVFDRLRAGATSSTWALPFWDSGPIGTRALGRYLLLPPSDATHLRLTLDPENAVPESDEANNVALVERPASVPLSDLTITNARLAEGTFALTYQNIGSVHAGYFMTLSTWFEWVDASGARVGDLVWHDGESLDPKYAMHLDAATVVSSATRVKFPLREFLAAPPDGATHLKVSADGPNTLLESNEGNNVAVLARLAAPLPDLAFTNVFLVPPKRERLVIGFKNVGKAPASEFSWTMVWVDAAGKALGEPYEGTVPALKANWQYGASSDSDDPKGKPMPFGKWLAQPKPAGAVRLEITIDPSNRIAESNEENNRRTFDEWSPPALAQPKKSDFVVGAVEVKDGALRITVRNIGAGDAAATDIWLMWFGAKGALPSSGAVDLPAIAAGKEVIVRVPLDEKTEASNILREPPRDGTRLRIFLDGSRKVSESNEDNNDAMLDRTTLAPPVTNQPPVADAGEDMTERDDDGDGIAIVRFYSRNSKDPDGKVVAWSWTLNGKEIATGQYPYWRTAPIGTHVVTLTVTDDKGATATDTVTVTVQSKPTTPPDLVVAELSWEPRLPQVDDVVTFTARVENRGGSRVGQVSVTSLDVDQKNDGTRDVPLAQFVTKDLEPDASETLRWKREYGRGYTWTAVAGTHAFFACADAKGVVRESDDMNNCARRVVTVGAKEEDTTRAPDLSWRAFLRDKTSYTYGVQVDNIGDADAPAHAWEIQWVDANGKPVGPPARYTFNYTLNAGKSVGNTVQYRKGVSTTSYDKYTLAPPSGAVILRLTVDPDNAIPEKNEANNTITLDPPPAPKSAAPSKPDLAITGITVTPAKPAANAKFTVSATVKNIGGASASASVMSFLLDIDNDDDPEQLPDSIALPSFTPGQSRMVIWDDVQSASAGTHGITVCVDVNDDINEIDEDENCKDRTVTVGAATGRAPGSSFAASVLNAIAEMIFGGLGATPIVASDGW